MATLQDFGNGSTQKRVVRADTAITEYSCDPRGGEMLDDKALPLAIIKPRDLFGHRPEIVNILEPSDRPVEEIVILAGQEPVILAARESKGSSGGVHH